MFKKQFVPGCLKIMFIVVVFSSMAQAQVTSALWGVSGEAWDPTNSILRDFTHVGYKGGGTNTIPNWPVGVNVTNFGAVADDGIDDSQAFNDAIAACPDYHAVLVPRGKFTILQEIEPQRDHFVLRGEDLYESVLFFPKYRSEVYIEERLYSPDRNVKNPVYDGFFIWSGGVEKSIENLTFEFREERKNGDWDYPGAKAITASGLSDSWFRNLYVKNADSVMAVSGTRISVLNIMMDQFNGRQNVEHEMDSYGGILPRNVSYSLFHNFHMTGRAIQPIDLNEASSYNVYSQYRGGELTDRSASYHGGSSHFDLYTDLDKNVRPTGHPSRSDETFWNVNDHSDFWEDVYNSSNSLILVGVGKDWPLTTTDSLWYESADYGLMTPDNLYLAQMNYFGYPLPDESGLTPVPAPYETDGDVFRVLPTDDITPGNEPDEQLKVNDAYFKFNLSDASETSVARARLRLTLNSYVIFPPFKLSVWSVTDDSWSEDTVTTTNKPASVLELDSKWVLDSSMARTPIEFDVTDFVRNELVGGDGVVSLYVSTSEGNSGWSGFYSSEQGVHPELIVERVADPVPGAPSAPKNIGSTPLLGNIILEWDDNPESDTATYTVYRTPYDFGALPIASGLVTSDHVDTSSLSSWRSGMMQYDQVYHYWITAVDEHGNESEKSLEFVAATLHPSNAPPTFSSTVSLSNAIAREAYSESLADEASDPESDQMYFMKVSGPDWLNVALDGTLSGTPEPGDAVTNAFIFQVTAIGGSTQKTVNIVVDLPADIPPGAPAAPTGLAATADYGSVSLDWDDNPEADLYSYNVYRSTTQGSGYSLMISNLTTSAAVDSNVVNATTYYYVVTAVDWSDNESAASSEVPALPGVDLTPPAAPTALAATPGDSSVMLDWADNSENDLASYSIFRSTNSGSYGVAQVTNLGSSTYSDTNVLNGTTYYYVVTATDTNGNESAQSTEVSATPDESLITYTTFLGKNVSGAADNYLSTPENWDNGPPVGRLGAISTNANCGKNTMTNYVVTQTAGTVSQGSFPNLNFVMDGGSWTLNGGAISCRANTYQNGAVFTLNDGTITTRNNSRIAVDGSGSQLIVNGGTISADRGIVVVRGGTVTINGGTIDSDKADDFGASGFSGSGTMNFNGGTLTAGKFTFQGASLATFGGTTPGSATFDQFGGSRHSDGAINLDWLPGTQMSLSITNATNNWAEALWNNGQLTYNGDGINELSNTWAEVTAEDGLEEGVRFNYDSATKTLSLDGGAPPGGYSQWAGDHGVGAATNDFDSDGVNNLYEYAFDGNPTNGLAPTNLPVFTRFGNGFIYVHPQRSDDTNLTYTVETTTNLMDSVSWTNDGYTVTGTNITGKTLNFVTNDVSTIENEKFIRVKIEQQ